MQVTFLMLKYVIVILLITNANMKACIILSSSIGFSTLNNTNLELATIEHTIFRATKMHNINLLNSDLNNVTLAGCILDGNLYDASSFDDLIISRSTLNDLIYQIGPIGSRKAYTSYFVNKDNVRCGCWNNYKGGTLEEFKNEVEKTYPSGEYHDEYMIAIETFKKYRELYLKSKKGDK